MTGVGRLLLKDDTVQNIREKIVIPNIEEKNELQTSNDVTSDLSSTATTIPSTETDFLTFSEMNAIEGIFHNSGHGKS